MGDYAVVEFSASDPIEIAVIPSNWFKNVRRNYCLWPACLSQDAMDKAIVQRIEPQKEWEEHNVRCLYETDSYEDAWEKLIEWTTNMVNESPRRDVDEDSRKRKRSQTDSEVENGADDISSPALNGCSFESQVLTLLETIKEQNNEIIRLLKTKVPESPSVSNKPSLPVALPMKIPDDMRKLEQHLASEKNCLALISYLSGLGGINLLKCTHRIMKALMTDELSSLYSYVGARPGKSAFSSLKLNHVVITSVREKFKSASESDVEEILKRWLKYGKERVLARQRRTNKSHNA